MVAMVVLALTIAVQQQDSPTRHIRASDPEILKLLDAGRRRSATFRGLVATLNESDVIVYVEPRVRHQNLGGYLPHNIVVSGGYRYLRLAVETGGAERRLVSLLAHELQHAVEVAQAPDARDAESLRLTFSRLASMFGCESTDCYETRAAKDVEDIVSDEFVAR